MPWKYTEKCCLSGQDICCAFYHDSDFVAARDHPFVRLMVWLTTLSLGSRVFVGPTGGKRNPAAVNTQKALKILGY